MYKKTTLIAAAVAGLVAVPAAAGHANPWAKSDDTVLSQYHDVNRALSVGSPGEDRMLGVMTRNAFGKLDGFARQHRYRDKVQSRDRFRHRSAVPSGSFGRGNGGGHGGRP